MDSDLRLEKVKRLKRIGHKQRIVQKHLKNYSTLISTPRELFTNRNVKNPHRLHKYRNIRCSNPFCMGCRNPRKIFGEPSMQERRFDQPALYLDDDLSSGENNEQ